MKKLLVFAMVCILLLSGCNTMPCVPATPTVIEVPVVPDLPNPQVPSRPEILLSKIDKATTDADTVRYLDATVEALMTYIESIERVVGIYQRDINAIKSKYTKKLE